MIRRGLLWIACAVVVWIAQGTLASLFPRAMVPDLTLVATVAVAVTARPLAGLCFAAGIGFGADILSGALLGQHALMRLVVFAAARLLGAQFDLRQRIPLAIFVAVLSCVDAFGLWALGRVFQEGSIFGLEGVLIVLARAFGAALLAPGASRLFGTLQERLEEGDTRREVRLEPRRPVF